MHRHITFALIVILALSACSQPTALPATAASSPSPLPTETPAPSATFTPTPTITLTPTPTPRLTWTPPAPPTPTPVGYYLSKDFGFSLTLPAGWEVLEESDSIVFGDQSEYIIAIAASGLLPQAPPEDNLNQVVEAFLSGAKYSVDNTGKAALQGDNSADYAQVTIEDDNGPATAFIYYTYVEPREYVFFVFGAQDAMAGNEEAIQSLVSSIQLQGLSLLGVDRQQALILGGGNDPEPKDLDPATTTSGAAAWVGLLYSGLVSMSPDLQIIPDLAQGWTVSPDGTVYTFTLRADAYFESGRPITAADFKYSWERAADPQTDSSVSETYLGDIQGFKDMHAGQADEISGVQVIDELTLRVTLDGPKPYFLAKLTYPTSYVLDRASVESGAEDWYLKPNASGPFRLRDYIYGDMLAFAPNPAYHTPAQVPVLVYKLNQPGKSIDYYRQGEQDIAYLGDPADIRAVQDPAEPLNAELSTSVSACTGLIQLNNSLPPMDDPNVRKALALAIDRQKLLDQFSEGTSLLAESILPPAMPGYNDQNRADAYDLEAAKEALKASKYAADMPALTVFDAGYAGQESDYTNALVSMWQEGLGLTVNVENLDPVDFSKAARARQGHVVLYGWCADYPDPENFLDVLYHSASQINVANYANPEVDALLEQARTELDPALRIGLYQQVEKLLLSDHAAIPTSYSIAYVLVKPRVKGYTVSPLFTRIFDRVAIEGSLP